MAEQRIKRGMGWLPDYPDFRDYKMDQDTVSSRLKRLGQQDSVKAMLAKVGVLKATRTKLPDNIDLRKWCSPIEDQDRLGSCTAHAGAGIIEYFEKKLLFTGKVIIYITLFEATSISYGFQACVPKVPCDKCLLH